MIFTLTLNPALDKTVEIPNLRVGEVNRIVAMRTDGGGKGINVSKVLMSMGEKSVAMGILGGNNGNAVKTYVENLGIQTDFTFAEGETRVNLKVIDPENKTNTDINEPGFLVGESVLSEIIEKLAQNVKNGDIVALSGSIPKGVTTDIYFTIIQKLKNSGALVFLDVDGEMFKSGVKAAPYLIKPNINELSDYLERNLETPEEVVSACAPFFEMGIERVAVSLGADGALFITKDEALLGEGLKVAVKSTVGAGDSVVASLMFSKVKNHSLEESAIHAVATGAANVTTSGTQPAEYALILEMMKKVVLRKIEK